MIALALHLLSAIFWAGSTFAAVRTGARGDGLRALLRPQAGAALVAILTGGFLWHRLHAQAFTGVERTLAVGAVCALLAFVIQVGWVAPALRRPRAGEVEQGQADRRARVGYRLAALLLAVTVVAMGVARFM